MTHQSHGRGTLIIDRRYPCVGRVRRASGTTDRKVFKSLNAMLDSLYSVGRVDLLRAIRDGKLRLFDVWVTFRLGHLNELPDVDSLKPLRETWVEWARASDVSGHYKKDRERSLRRLGVTNDHAITDLPDLLLEYRFKCQREKHAPAFRQTKSIVQAFLRDRFGRSHALYMRVSDIQPLKAGPKRKPNPQTPEQARVIREALGKHGDTWWAMCCTGMMPDELWGEKWRVGPNYIHVMGTKREARDRKVPRIFTPVKPPVRQPTTFNHALTRATNGKVQPYDARRTYAHWLEEAGVTRTRTKLYMGHAARDVTDLYLRHELAAYLDGDANLLREYLGEGLKRFPDISPDRERVKEA